MVITNIFEIMIEKINIPAKMIVAKLIAKGKTPKSAKVYTTDIVYQTLRGRTDDPQVFAAVEELQKQLSM